MRKHLVASLFLLFCGLLYLYYSQKQEPDHQDRIKPSGSDRQKIATFLIDQCRTLIQKHYGQRTNLTIADLSGTTTRGFSERLADLIDSNGRLFILDQQTTSEGNSDRINTTSKTLHLDLEEFSKIREEIDIGILYYKHYNRSNEFRLLESSHFEAIKNGLKYPGLLLVIDETISRTSASWRRDLARQYDSSPFAYMQNIQPLVDRHLFIALFAVRKPIDLSEELTAMNKAFFSAQLQKEVATQMRVSAEDGQDTHFRHRTVWNSIKPLLDSLADKNAQQTAKSAQKLESSDFDNLLQNYKEIPKDRLYKELFALQLAETIPDYGKDHLEEMETRDTNERWQRLAPLFEIREETTVADIGCGSGNYTFRFAKEVGPKGHVYALDVQEQMVGLIRTKIAKKIFNPYNNVTAIHSRIDDAGLPKARIDQAFLINVHFHYYPTLLDANKSMIASIYRALKKGGRLVIEDGTITIPPKTVCKTIVKHYLEAGFSVAKEPIILNGYYECLVVLKK